MNAEQVRGIVRALVTTAGGIGVAAGYLNSETWASILGALATLGGIAWSIYSNGLQNTLTQLAKEPDVHEIVVDTTKLANEIPSPKVVPLT